MRLLLTEGEPIPQSNDEVQRATEQIVLPWDSTIFLVMLPPIET